jgi:ribosomal protein L37AE/L43A
MYKGACVPERPREEGYMNSSYEMIECTICHDAVLHKDLSNHIHQCLECGWRIDQSEKSKCVEGESTWNWQTYHEVCPARNIHTGKVFLA